MLLIVKNQTLKWTALLKYFEPKDGLLGPYENLSWGLRDVVINYLIIVFKFHAFSIQILKTSMERNAKYT